MKKKVEEPPYPVRVDVVVTFSDGVEVVRKGMTPTEMRDGADAMDSLSNLHPMIFGPRA